MTTPSPKCLIVGGSGTLGSAICQALHREGALLAFTYYQNKNRAETLEKEIPGSLGLYCDLRDPKGIQEGIQKGVEHLRGLDCLIVAAGISGREEFYQCNPPIDKLLDISPDDLEELLSVNTKGSLFACQAAYPFLKEAGSGNILLIGSMDGIKGVPSPIHFATSKAALRGLVDSLSKEVGRHKICVNLVAPGILEGGASERLADNTRKEYLKHSSLQRFGKMEEVAEMVAWLAFENTYLTGQALLLDGGL